MTDRAGGGWFAGFPYRFAGLAVAAGRAFALGGFAVVFLTAGLVASFLLFGAPEPADLRSVALFFAATVFFLLEIFVFFAIFVEPDRARPSATLGDRFVADLPPLLSLGTGELAVVREVPRPPTRFLPVPGVLTP